jgi:hypothetical protein
MVFYLAFISVLPVIGIEPISHVLQTYTLPICYTGLLLRPDGIEPPSWDYESHELPLLHGRCLPGRGTAPLFLESKSNVLLNKLS